MQGFQPGLYVLLRGTEGEKLRSYVEMPMTEVLDLHGCKLWMLTAAPWLPGLLECSRDMSKGLTNYLGFG